MDASPHLMAPTQEEEFKGDKRLASPQTRNSGHWYNHEHRHSVIRYVTPAERHVGQDRPLLACRHVLYQQACQRNPRRWSRQTRNWTPVAAVTLNPEQDAVVQAALVNSQVDTQDGGAA